MPHRQSSSAAQSTGATPGDDSASPGSANASRRAFLALPVAGVGGRRPSKGCKGDACQLLSGYIDCERLQGLTSCCELKWCKACVMARMAGCRNTVTCPPAFLHFHSDDASLRGLRVREAGSKRQQAAACGSKGQGFNLKSVKPT